MLLVLPLALLLLLLLWGAWTVVLCLSGPLGGQR
jgi:hypothetical protein